MTDISVPFEHEIVLQLRNATMRLAEIADILTEIQALTEGRPEGASNPDAREQRSSVEVKTSTRGVDVTVKSYVGSDVQEAGTAAVDEYMRVLEDIQNRLNKAYQAA